MLKPYTWLMLEQVHSEILPNADTTAGYLAEDTGGSIVYTAVRKLWLMSPRPCEVTSR
jgi:hypothetical protein